MSSKRGNKKNSWVITETNEDDQVISETKEKQPVLKGKQTHEFGSSTTFDTVLMIIVLFFTVAVCIVRFFSNNEDLVLTTASGITFVALLLFAAGVLFIPAEAPPRRAEAEKDD